MHVRQALRGVCVRSGAPFDLRRPHPRPHPPAPRPRPRPRPETSGAPESVRAERESQSGDLAFSAACQSFGMTKTRQMRFSTLKHFNMNELKCHDTHCFFINRSLHFHILHFSGVSTVARKIRGKASNCLPTHIGINWKSGVLKDRRHPLHWKDQGLLVWFRWVIVVSWVGSWVVRGW